MPYIIIEDLPFYGFHGIYAHEQSQGTKFKVTARIEIEEMGCFQSDRLEDALNYELLVADILEVGTTMRFKLLERLCDEIMVRLLTYTQVRAVELRVSKWIHTQHCEDLWVSVLVQRSRPESV